MSENLVTQTEPETDLLRDMDDRFIASLVRTCCDKSNPPSEALQKLLALAIGVTRFGHICLDLNAETTPQEARGSLGECSELVGDGSGTQPFVSEHNRLYLRRFWNYEKKVAARLLEMSRLACPAIPADVAQQISSLQIQKNGASFPLTTGQQEAVKRGLGQTLTIITGGPGTGKTTVAASLLRLLAACDPAQKCRVLMAAPTGKAAARLDESVRSGLSANPPQNMDIQPASTIHRLLGFLPNSPYFRHNRDNPLRADVVLVDEASMIALPQMAKLLDAIPPTARLILLGDKNQLASVEPGSAMAEICDSQNLKPSIVELTENKRFGDDSAVKPISEAVNAQMDDKAWGLVNSPIGADGKKVCFHDSSKLEKNEPSKEFVEEIESRFADFAKATTPEEAFRALAKFRVLCALRRGRTGATRINRTIEDILFPSRKGDFYSHRVILITKNDYGINLFNGDVGVVLPDPNRAGELAVFFENRPTPVPAQLLPEHETAFAMTVHKAQGSGFGHVMVILPSIESQILTKELLYTAITRTETGVDLWCTETSFKAAVQTRTTRTMGLKEKLDA